MRFTYTFEESCELTDNSTILFLLATPRQMAQELWDYCGSELPVGAQWTVSYISNEGGGDTVDDAPNSTYYINADQDYPELHDNDILI